MMSRFLCRPIEIILGSALIMCSVGCDGTAPAPSGSTPSSASSESASNRNVAAENKPFELEPDFTLLTRDQFEAFGTEPETWVATQEGIACFGKPRGYLYSKQSYGDFTLRVDYRFHRPEKLEDDTKFKGNTGFLVYINGEHKLWPVCIEVQGKYSQIGAIKENGGAEPVKSEDDEPARRKARKAVGDWNGLEIVSKAGALRVQLNGTPISSSEPGALTSGLVGIQSEDHKFEVRRMRIRAE